MKLIVAGAIFFASTTVQAQTNSPATASTTAAPASDWNARAVFNLRPLIGQERPLDPDKDLVDESDAELFFRLERPLNSALNLRLQFGITSTPSFLDRYADSPRSTQYAQISVGEVEDRLTSFREYRDNMSGPPRLDIQDQMIPYARYRFIRGFNSFLDDPTYTDHRFTGGLRFRDVRGIMCTQADLELPNPDPARRCSAGPGFYYDLEGSFNVVASDDPNRERIFPTLRLQLVSRPLWRDIRLFAEGQVEFSFYTNERVPGPNGLEDREDRLTRVNLGVDLSQPLLRLLKRERGIEFTIAARWEENRSNRVDKRYDRLYLAPSLSLTQRF